mgnify:CR=1 FL=1
MWTALAVLGMLAGFALLAHLTTPSCPRCKAEVIEYMEYGEACSNPGCTWGWEGRDGEWRWRVEDVPTDTHFGPATIEVRRREPVSTEPERAPRRAERR